MAVCIVIDCVYRASGRGILTILCQEIRALQNQRSSTTTLLPVEKCIFYMVFYLNVHAITKDSKSSTVVIFMAS